jgi:hypothetical protein
MASPLAALVEQIEFANLDRWSLGTMFLVG